MSPFERTTEKTFAAIRVMWVNGPSRRWSEEKTSEATVPLAEGGFGGVYVCQACKEACGGVYREKRHVQTQGLWVCGGCREQFTVRQKKTA